MKYNEEQLEKLMNDFIDGLSVERNLSANTLYAYKNDITNFLKWLKEGGGDSLDGKQIQEYFSVLQNERGLSARTIRRKYVSIQQYTQYINGELDRNEVFFRFSTRKFQVPRTLPKTLSTEEISSLITAVSLEYQEAKTDYKRTLAVRNMSMIELLFCLGLRIGEVAALNIEDYCESEDSLLIHGKGNKERILFISSPAVSQKLKLWLCTRPEMNPQDEAMYVNRYGQRLGIYGIENIFRKYRKMAGINPHSTPHYLRHSFATQLLNNGAGIRDVQELMGHSSIATTQIYTEVSLARKKEVLEKYNGRNFMDPV